MIKNNHLKPFLRWAGGKNWLIKYLGNALSELEYRQYHEPFLGGGSVFFSFGNRTNSFLSDTNEDLVNTYIQIRDDVSAVVKKLSKYENTKDYYYWVRDSYKPRSLSAKAARFIYLNQTSFNGIYRVNLKGKYNVPYGFRKKNFFQPELLFEASGLLSNATIFKGDFFEGLDNIESGDLVFLDPPYTISHNHNGFLKYNESLFSLSDQIRLSQFIDELKSIGAYYILTNAAHDDVK